MVNEFQEGKIVFWPPAGPVGRVIGLPGGGGARFGKSPLLGGRFQLTDVIRNGKGSPWISPSAPDNMISYVAPDYPQGTRRPTGAKEDLEIELEWFGRLFFAPGRRRAVVVFSRPRAAFWTPMSVAETYSDGRGITFQKGSETTGDRRDLRRSKPDPVLLRSPIPTGKAWFQG